MKAYQCFSGTYHLHLQRGSESPVRAQNEDNGNRIILYTIIRHHNNYSIISISNSRYVISFSMEEGKVVEQTFPLVDFYMPIAMFKCLTRTIMHFI
jgi:hypothetical protein